MNNYYSPPSAFSADATYHIPAARRACNRIGLGMLLFLIVPIISTLFVQIVSLILFPAFLESTWFVWVNQIFSLYMIAAPICLLVIGQPTADIPVRKKSRMSPPLLMLIFCIMQFVAVAGSILSNLLMSVTSALTGNESVSPLDELLKNAPLSVIFVVVVVIGPFIEELICRQAIMNHLLPYGEKSAILISALYFGIMHQNFYQLFYATGVGILLGYVYARTGRFSDVCILHILFNFFGSFIPMWLLGYIDPAVMEDPLSEFATEWMMANPVPMLGLALYEFLSYGLAITGLILLILFWRRAILEPAALPLPKKSFCAVYLQNAGTILFLIAGVGSLILSVFQY